MDTVRDTIREKWDELSRTRCPDTRWFWRDKSRKFMDVNYAVAVIHQRTSYVYEFSKLDKNQK